MPEIAESRLPLRVLNTDRPVPREVGIWITSTPTNTVEGVYHRFETFTKVKYSTLYRCRVREIFCYIYYTKNLSVRENVEAVDGSKIDQYYLESLIH